MFTENYISDFKYIYVCKICILIFVYFNLTYIHVKYKKFIIYKIYSFYVYIYILN